MNTIIFYIWLTLAIPCFLILQIMLVLRFPLFLWLLWLEIPILNKIPKFWMKILPVDGGDGVGDVVHIVFSMFFSYITLVMFLAPILFVPIYVINHYKV